MHESIVEVKDGVLNTFEDQRVEVRGGTYLSPQAWLRTMSEVEHLHAKTAELEERSLIFPSMVLAAGLLGAALGFWLGTRRSD